MPERTDPSQGIRDGLARLDPVLEHRMRLGACVLLSRGDALSFSRLKELLTNKTILQYRRDERKEDQ